MTLTLIDLAAIRTAETHHEPYDYFTNGGFLKPATVTQLRTEFPDITKTGYFPASDIELTPTFQTLIDELESPELTAALSERFGTDLSPYPRLTTIRKLSAKHEGAIHCDSRSKVMTMLVYMNDDWGSSDGRLRVLYNETDMDKYKLEVNPQLGNVFAFMRADHSWHGHTPFAGERRVVQIAWIRDQAELERKKKRSRVTSFFKSLFKPQPQAKAA